MRMPLFLPFDMAKKWVEKELTQQEYRATLEVEMPSEALSYYSVNTIRSGKPRADNKGKDEPYELPELPKSSFD